LEVPGVTAGRSRPGTVAPSVGTLRAAFLLVHAADVSPEASVSGPQEMIQASRAWFRVVSYGELDFDVTTPPRWLPLPASSAEYAAAPARYLSDAVAAADPYVDFSRIDVVYLAPAAETPVTTSGYAVLNSFGVHADGREIRFWVPFEPAMATASAPGLLLHETGHLLGLPDLYVAGVQKSFHRWDLMAGSGRFPTELLAWHRWKLGWLDAREIVCITGRTRRVVTLTPLERPGGTKAVFVRRGTHVVALEVRQRTGYDTWVCSPGVLAYDVDQAPFKRGPVQIYAVRPDNAPHQGDCSPKWNAPLDIGRGETRRLDLSDWGVRIELLGRLRDGSYRVRVTTR
jgi:M6 family metalloprotease-like protein